ncbi:MAG: hypothetical protein KAV70_00220, partial [Bacteroidales bacterium]|nr:hypothetical protein [Bacteroidales bacterium]
MKIFILLSRIPYPLEKGDKLRAFYHIKYLSKNNEITLFALNDSKVNIEKAFQALQPYCRSINFFDLSKFSILFNVLLAFFNGKPLQSGYFFSSRAKNRINKIISETKPDHIFCQLVRVAEYVKNQNIPKTLDYQDVFSKGVERRIQPAS